MQCVRIMYTFILNPEIEHIILLLLLLLKSIARIIHIRLEKALQRNILYCFRRFIIESKFRLSKHNNNNETLVERYYILSRCWRGNVCRCTVCVCVVYRLLRTFQSSAIK